MRDSVDAEALRRSIKKSVLSYQSGKLAPRPIVVDSSNLPCGFEGFKVRNLKSELLFGLALASWYLGDLGVLLRMDIEEELSRRDEDDDYGSITFIVTKSEPEMVCFLRDTTKWHSREFFGNIIKFLELGLKKLRLRIQSKKIKKPQRKRGYNDHGGIAKDPYWKSARAFWKDTEEQLLLYENRQKRDDAVMWCLGWCG